jgi:hypothetical protein
MDDQGDFELVSRLQTPNGRWMVVPSGDNVLLVDLAFKNTPDEKAYREFKSRLDPYWHKTQAEMAEAADDWFAATFHWAWVVKAVREQGKSDDERYQMAQEKLHSAHVQWLAAVNESPNGELSGSDRTSLLPPANRDILKSLPEEDQK